MRLIKIFTALLLVLVFSTTQAVTVYRLVDDYQFFDSNGDPLNGGLLYTYTAGTTTNKTTYQESTGVTPHANPIVLDSAGRLPADVFGTTGAYKLVLKTSSGTTIWTRDNITGINDSATVELSEWNDSGLTPTYVGATSFTLSGDQTTDFHGGRRLKITDSGGVQYSTITGSSYSNPNTTVTVANDSSTIDSGISDVDLGVVSAQNTSVVGYKLYARHVYTFDGTDIFVDGVDQNNAANTITWTKPKGLRAVRATVVGGGGGSGYCDSSAGQSCAGSGGAGGGTSIEFLTSLNDTETVTVGAGGTAGSPVGPVAATAGGTSSFGPGTPYLQATGGAAGDDGTSGTSVSALTAGVLGGIGSNGDLNIRGGSGGPAFRFSATSSISGHGGNSTFGGGAQSVVPDNSGNAGGAYGGGASGGASDDGADRAGAAGAAGVVILEEFY